jgi:hypothetical protein
MYGGHEVGIDDRLLAHLQIVIITKFRKSEPFLMSWLDSQSIGDGRSALWLHPGLAIYFKFLGSRTPAIDRDWLDYLMTSADSSTGLVLRDEQGRLAHAEGERGRR